MLRDVMPRFSHRSARCGALLLALFASRCSFEPVARTVQQEQLATEPAQLLGRLDARGQHVLLGRLDPEGGVQVSISRWRKRESCALPVVPSGLLSAPAERPRGARGPLLYAPAGVARGDGDTELVLMDEACAVHDDYFGRLTAISDLPPKKILADYIRKAMELNEQGIKVPGRVRTVKKARPLAVPTDLRSALKKNKAAQTAFEAFSPSHRNEYIEWITEAKQDATRTRRIGQAIEWISKGKSRNWKYER